ncbi:MAG: tetratricopeptide repeat protein, partial [Anaerolineae bacterium]
LALLIIAALAACQPFIPPQTAATPTPSAPELLAEARALQAERHYGAALQRLEQAAALEAGRDDPTPLLEAGQIYLAQHRWPLAEDAFNRALARAPHNVEAAIGLARAVSGQDDLFRARRFWREAVDLDPTRAESWAGLGKTLLDRGDFDQALAAFEEGVRRGPDPAAQWYLAVLTAPEAGLAAVDQLAAIPDDASPDLIARRDHLLATLAALPPNAAHAGVGRATGLALVQWQEWAAATRALTLSTQANPDDADAWAFLGHALGRWGRPALAAFARAEALAPDSALPLYFKGIYLREKDQAGLALEAFLRAAELDPENAAITVEAARTLAGQGDYVSAEAWYIAATLIAPDDVEFQLLLARFYIERGVRLESAGLEAARKAVALDPANPVALDLLGWAQALAGSPADGERTLRSALEKDPNLVSARYHLAKALEAQGRVEEAAQEYTRVIDWDIDGFYRKRALVERR